MNTFLTILFFVAVGITYYCWWQSTRPFKARVVKDSTWDSWNGYKVEITKGWSKTYAMAIMETVGTRRASMEDVFNDRITAEVIRREVDTEEKYTAWQELQYESAAKAMAER